MADGGHKKLTVKQRRFADAYLGVARGNATEAARIAGYSDPEVSAFDCKQNQAIRAYIDDRLNAESLTSAEVLAELTDVARAAWKHFVTILEFDDDGNPVRVKMDLSSKVKSLELLGKHHNLFADKLHLDATDQFVNALREFGRGRASD